MPVTIEPEPPEDVREAIAAALGEPPEQGGGWSAAALLEAVEDGEPDP